MKVVFIASHSQRKELGDSYKKINDALESHGHDVFTGNLFSPERDTALETKTHREGWYKEVLQHIKGAELVVIEISYPSTANVGHILTQALDLGKPVIALYKSGRDPFFLRGRIDEKLTLLEYTDGDIDSVVSSALDYAASIQDVRFNFFISPQIGTYLDWISKIKRIPRAVYLRRLIENDMNTNKEFEESES